MNISQHRLSCSLRCGAAAIAAGAALLTAGCGSTKVDHHRNASQSTFASKHTAQQVEQHFQAATGQALSDSPNASWDTLSLPAGNTQDYNRFGAFTIDVLRRPNELSVFTTQNGRKLTPDAQGVYWPLTADSNGYYDPAKVYGNVVLTWSTQSHTTNGQFTMLNAILSTLGQGASAVMAKLPASELSCQVQGLTATGQREGTCDDNGVTRTVVNRGHTLHAPSMDVQVTKTKLGRVIKPADSFEPPVYAKGAFVAVALKISNTGSTPLDGLDETELEIDGKYYSQDFDATFDLAPQDTFPMQPGDGGTTALAFDVPLNVAVDALTQGEIVVPDSTDDTVDFSTHLYAIRLAEPTAEDGQGSAPSPAPAPAPAPSPTLAPAGSTGSV
ncbi:MAG TPA: hypothetical protein VMB27_14055 [Solirubrobacteraceae bacterium]|nr:hypothetical protein [Solirubrobacteraceae bacterium]